MNYQELWQSLEPHYGTSEAKAITRTVLEVKFGLTLTYSTQMEEVGRNS